MADAQKVLHLMCPRDGAALEMQEPGTDAQNKQFLTELWDWLWEYDEDILDLRFEYRVPKPKEEKKKTWPQPPKAKRKPEAK